MSACEHIRTVGVAAVVAASAMMLVLVPASAAPEPSGRTVQIIGEERFSPDEFFTQTFRFSPRRIRVHSGETITWTNHTSDGHSMSVVPRDQLPRTAREVANCAACGPFFEAHFPGGPGLPPVLVLDDFKPAVGAATFDSVGDSLLVGTPELGIPSAVSARVTAPAGTTLMYLCIFHPWMQATIEVAGAEQGDD